MRNSRIQWCVRRVDMPEPATVIEATVRVRDIQMSCSRVIPEGERHPIYVACVIERMQYELVEASRCVLPQ